MSEQLACPSCGVVLRLPSRARRLRCPKCAHEITLGPSSDSPAAGRLPLPFEPPSRPRAAASHPPRMVPPSKPVAKGRFIRDEEESREEDDLARPVRRREETIRDHPRYPAVAAQCKAARVGVIVLMVAAVTAALITLLFAVFLGLVAAANTTYPQIFLICIGLMILHTLACLGGFGFCIAGPPGMRGTAVFGILVTLMHTGVLVLLIIPAARIVPLINANLVPDAAMPKAIFFMSSSLQNLNMLTDLPWLFIRDEVVKADAFGIILMFVGSLLEFAKISILGTIVHYYATEGKGHELGFRSLRFVYRIIWVVIIALILKLLALLMFYLFGGEGLARQFFRIPVALFTVAYFLWWTFAWFAQYTAMKDTIEVLTPERYLDRRLTLDDV